MYSVVSKLWAGFWMAMKGKVRLDYSRIFARVRLLTVIGAVNASDTGERPPVCLKHAL